MKRFAATLSFIYLAVALLSPLIARAAPYGSGEYGGCDYDVACTSSTELSNTGVNIAYALIGAACLLLFTLLLVRSSKKSQKK